MIRILTICLIIISLNSCHDDPDFSLENPKYEADNLNIFKQELDNTKNYPATLESIKKSGKKMLIYFNAYSQINSRISEDKIWNDQNLSIIKEKYEFVNLRVDDNRPNDSTPQYYSYYIMDTLNTYGKLNMELQVKLIDTVAFPMYVIVDDTKGVISTFYDFKDSEKFEIFLNQKNY